MILTGTVDSYPEKLLSENMAKSVTGVVALNNEIDIVYATHRPDYEIQLDIVEALKWSILVDEGHQGCSSV